MALCALLQTAFRTYSSNVAVCHAADQVTFGDLLVRAEHLASRIRRAVSGDPRMPVAVCMQRGIPMVVALLGVLFSGHPYVPIDPRLPSKRKEYIVQDSQAPTIITNNRQSWMSIPTLDASESDFSTDAEIDGSRVPDDNGTNLAVSTASNPSAYVIYTSGSTGKPKGVEVSQENVVRVLTSFDGILADREEFVALTTIAFDISALEIFWPLTRGRLLRIADHVWNVPLHAKAVVQATPSTYQVLLESQELHDAVILVGGEALPLALAKRLAAKSPRVINCYGPTEATIWAATWEVCNIEHATRIPIGRPIAGNEFVLDADGELWIRGNINKYWHREELNAVAFKDGWYRTGDICKESDGEYFFVGRRDAQVKLLGHRIELGEVESIVNDLPGVYQSAAIVDRNSLSLFIAGDHRVQEAEVRCHLRDWLPHYMVPRCVRILPQLPMTDNDKIDRLALLRMKSDAAQIASDAVRSQGSTSPKVTLINFVRELLTEHGIEDDLPFTIDSLGAVAFVQSLPLHGLPPSWHPIHDGIPLLFASQHTGVHAFVDALLALGADDVVEKPRKQKQRQRNPIVVDAARDGDLETLASLSDNEIREVDRFGSSGMHWAASSGHLEVCRFLHSRGLSTTYADKKSGRQALHWAARQGHLHILEWLAPPTVDILTQDRTTPLQLAAWGGFVDAADWLLQRGANMNHVNQWGCTIVHFASLSGQVLMCAYLHKQGVLLGQRNSQGHHALHKAAYGGHVELCRWLRDSLHLAITDEDARGQTPSMLARKAGFMDLAHELDPTLCAK